MELHAEDHSQVGQLVVPPAEVRHELIRSLLERLQKARKIRLNNG